MPVNYGDWQPTCDTLHAHSQVLGKLATKLAPPEPQLQHSSLRLTARGMETLPLPTPNGSGAFVVALDLHRHEASVEHSDGREQRVPLTPNRSVAEVTGEVLAAVRRLAGPVEMSMTPQEVPWTAPLNEDTEHAAYDTAAVKAYFAEATRAALVLAAVRAPYRGRSTPLNMWWGSFDLAVSFFSGRTAEPPSSDFIWRNAGDAQQIELGWWPGDQRYDKPAFYGFAYPAIDEFAGGPQWNAGLGEYVLDSDDVSVEAALEFCRSLLRHGCSVCAWDPALAASLEGSPPPVR
jgi:hypothetical protein